jgi:hypothetical protein
MKPATTETASVETATASAVAAPAPAVAASAPAAGSCRSCGSQGDRRYAY